MIKTSKNLKYKKLYNSLSLKNRNEKRSRKGGSGHRVQKRGLTGGKILLSKK